MSEDPHSFSSHRQNKKYVAAHNKARDELLYDLATSQAMANAHILGNEWFEEHAQIFHRVARCIQSGANDHTIGMTVRDIFEKMLDAYAKSKAETETV